MRHILTVLLFFLSIISYGQNSPSVIAEGGQVDDKYLGIDQQFLTSDRLVSGSDLFNLTFDSIPKIFITADEIFLTDSITTLTNIIGTTTRWNTTNSGISKFNDLGVQGIYMQQVYNDSIFRVYTTQGTAGIQAFDRVGTGITYYAGDISVKPDEIWTRVYDPSNVTDSEIRVGFGRIKLGVTDSLLITGLDFSEGQDIILAIDTATNKVYTKTLSASSGTVNYNTYSSGSVSSTVSRLGGSATTITNPGTGSYNYQVASGAHIMEIDFLGNDTNLNSGVLTISIDNSANSRDRYFIVQVLQRTTNGQVDPTSTATNYTQSSSGNITTIQISNLGGFGAAGYRIMLR